MYRYDLATASDLRYYALPDLQKRLKELENRKAEEDAATGGGTDTVTPEAIAEIVARWTSIPVTRLVSTEKEKLLRMERILAESVRPYFLGRVLSILLSTLHRLSDNPKLSRLSPMPFVFREVVLVTLHVPLPHSSCAVQVVLERHCFAKP